jgi:hypothetical protein
MLHAQNTATLKGQFSDSLSCDKVLGCLSIYDPNGLILPHLIFFLATFFFYLFYIHAINVLKCFMIIALLFAS